MPVMRALAFKHLCEKQLTVRNPTTGVRRPKANAERVEAPVDWLLLACNVAVPQLLWFRAVRANTPLLFVISIIINVGMWLERFIITVVSLHRDYLPSSWGMYRPTFWDWSTFLGTIGLFAALLFLFLRLLPMISIFEMQELVDEANGGER